MSNAANLSQEQSQSLRERTGGFSDNEEKIIQSLKQLYSCKPVSTTYDVYDEKATFRDPIGIAEGRASIKSQFDALASMCAKGDLPKFRVLENPSTVPKSTLLVDQDVGYHFKEDGPASITVNSLVTVETNEAGKITKHVEEWDHKADSTGAFSEARRKITAKLVEMVKPRET
ncbi:hypothetical protein SISNIDRAFT_485618 [Sistotremastrum niveocremeum HHB9708]|uniref:SnoaL-like domain-containing protein n=1 Tax=Sistotremastrum niveocremeum HHB9708 TaxID=1314777 RepID=A0A164UM69_9AGAM|nr:hypothetical protein SISNIDRAFT_485618 [Sistotremastrum niveocremeum HHB9708]